jgi:hypothetical protein
LNYYYCASAIEFSNKLVFWFLRIIFILANENARSSKRRSREQEPEEEVPRTDLFTLGAKGKEEGGGSRARKRLPMTQAATKRNVQFTKLSALSPIKVSGSQGRKCIITNFLYTVGVAVACNFTGCPLKNR